MRDAAAVLIAVLAVGPVVLASTLGRRASGPVVFEVGFPRSVEPPQVTAAMRSVSGLLPPLWRRLLTGTPTITLEVRADAAGIAHRLAVDEPRAAQVTGQLTAAIP